VDAAASAEVLAQDAEKEEARHTTNKLKTNCVMCNHTRIFFPGTIQLLSTPFEQQFRPAQG